MVLVNTSLYEGFPNTFIQALKNKTPILSLNVNPDDFLTKNEIGFFCRNDFTQMENNLKLLLQNKELYESYSKNAFLYVKNNHNIEEIAKEWIKLIEIIFNT